MFLLVSRGCLNLLLFILFLFFFNCSIVLIWNIYNKMLQSANDSMGKIVKTPSFSFLFFFHIVFKKKELES